MIKLMINTIKILMKKKSYIIVGIIVPAFIIVFFSFEFGGEYKYKVGVIDNDDSYVSKEIIKAIDDLGDIQSIKVNEEDYEILLITQQIQMVVIIDDNFQNKILNLQQNEIKIKSLRESDVKAVVESAVDLKCDNLSMISKISNKDINIFKDINQQFNDTMTMLTLNDVNEQRPEIKNSLGFIIFVIFIVASNIANFLIEDDENKTKIRILSSGISKWKYYVALIFVFYIMSSLTVIIYFLLAKTLSIDFGMENSMNFLMVMLLLNLVAISFNLCIVSFTRSRYTSSIVNILIVVPSCMLSGVFWDFDMMPQNLQDIGRFMPTRWVYICIENLQQTSNLNSINTYLSGMVILSLLFLMISFIKLKINREV